MHRWWRNSIVASLSILVIGMASPAPAWHVTREPSPFGGFYDREWAPRLPMCLTNYQIRRAVAEAGFSDIFLNVPNDGYIQVRARRGAWIYLIRFNYCTGRIEEVRELRPA
jgi:hypothetical protein